MATRAALVSGMWDLGFPLGPEPDAACTGCGCMWGNHLLIALGSPLGGGGTVCPVTDCDCHVQWGVNITLDIQ